MELHNLNQRDGSLIITFGIDLSKLLIHCFMKKICFNQSVSRNVTQLPRKMINFQLINLEILNKEL